MAGKRIVFYPYVIYSKSCRDVVNKLRTNATRVVSVYPDRNYVPRTDDFIVNWGNAHYPKWWRDGLTIINKPDNVAVAVNKLLTLQKLLEANVPTVPFTADTAVAKEWEVIAERHKLRGHSGDGIRFSTPDTIEKAPLYTKFLPNSEEYRVHVFNGEVIDYAKKYKITPLDGNIIFTNEEKIKNVANGWGFLRGVARREGVQKYAIEAVKALGLDFGVVDILRHNKKSYVLEVGTAPGLSNVGLELYANAITRYAEQ